MKAEYSIVIQWSPVDQVYVASLPEFGPYALTHGETYAEAVRNGEEALTLLMETTTPLPQPDVFDKRKTKAA
jgi:predicted RNase H-like HicB family nuclease